MAPEEYLCRNPFEGEGSITNENGPKRRAQRTVHRQECDGMFCARNGLIGDYNPLRHVETLDGSPLSVAFAIHPNLPIVVDARLKQDSYTINRVPFHRFGASVTLMRYQAKVNPRDTRCVRSVDTSQPESS